VVDEVLCNFDSESKDQCAEEDENTHPKRASSSAGNVTDNAEGDEMSQGMEPARGVQSSLVCARKE
jgi:hypothetical protein